MKMNNSIKSFQRKPYSKPAMEIIEMNHSADLLVGSSNDPTPGRGGEYGYIPSIGADDMNKLA